MGWVEPVSAISTAAAALIALGLGSIAEYRNLKDRRERRAEERRAQAIRVAAWIYGEGGSMVSGPLSIAVQNASDEPVWQVQVNIAPGAPPFDEVEDLDTPEVWELEILAPGTTEEKIIGYADKSIHASVDVTFGDNSGNRWWRSRRGDLAPMPSGEVLDVLAEPESPHERTDPPSVGGERVE